MLSSTLVTQLGRHNSAATVFGTQGLLCPEFNPMTYYRDAATSPFIHVLARLRHCIEAASDHYFSECGATKVDLFMLTTSVSSPMGPGSNSEAVAIQFGPHLAYLTDSSQFGFEPLILNGFENLYCYLPSMRGEDWDKRHLNQFFHCEAEIKGRLADVMTLVEGYIASLAAALSHTPALYELLSIDAAVSRKAVNELLSETKFQRISFDDACRVLDDDERFVVHNETGRDITALGEVELLRRIGAGLRPVWVTHYDRNRVPFYQKPCNNGLSVENADLLFPSLIEGSFGGEIVGAGQRQDTTEELLQSFELQGVSSAPYEWYIDLRNDTRYQPTSGFGLGIERFLTWILCRSDIKEVALYPRLKGVLCYP